MQARQTGHPGGRGRGRAGVGRRAAPLRNVGRLRQGLGGAAPGLLTGLKEGWCRAGTALCSVNAQASMQQPAPIWHASPWSATPTRRGHTCGAAPSPRSKKAKPRWSGHDGAQLHALAVKTARSAHTQHTAHTGRRAERAPHAPLLHCQGRGAGYPQTLVLALRIETVCGSAQARRGGVCTPTGVSVKLGSFEWAEAGGPGSLAAGQLTAV